MSPVNTGPPHPVLVPVNLAEICFTAPIKISLRTGSETRLPSAMQAHYSRCEHSPSTPLFHCRKNAFQKIPHGLPVAPLPLRKRARVNLEFTGEILLR